MADTDLPNGFGAIQPAPRRPRPIASPFGIFPDPWQTPNPSQTLGFNVQPEAPTPTPTNPMGVLASFVPSKQDVASTLGAPVDALAGPLTEWACRFPAMFPTGEVASATRA
jgi:hypothetical protein